MSQRIHTDEGAQPVAAYSQATQAGPLVFVSGQIPLVPDTGELLGEDMQRATRQCIANAETILRKAGLTLNHVVKASVFLTSMDDYADMDAAYRDAMPAPYPAREAVAVQALPKGARVEISMIAANSLKPHTMFFKKFLHYLNPLNLFKKSEGDGLNLRMMHGINKISFFAFLVCLTVMLYRWFLRS